MNLKELDDHLRRCVSSHHFMKDGHSPDRGEYQRKFSSAGGAKADAVIEHIKDQNVEPQRLGYVSIGGADGSEAERILEATDIHYAAVLEKDPGAATVALEKSASIRRRTRKELLVFQGDVLENLDACCARLAEWQDLGVDGLVVSAQAVLHELPRRSPGYEPDALFGRLFRNFDTRIFHSREPVELGDDDWPEDIWLRVGSRGDELVPDETVAALGRFLASKYNLTSSKVACVTDGYVRIPRLLAREVVRFVVYYSDEDHFHYETDEFHGEISPNELRRQIGNCVQGHVSVDRTNSKTFTRRYKEMGISARSTAGDDLPCPRTFAVFKAAHVVDDRGRDRPRVRLRYAPTFKGELQDVTQSRPGHLELLCAALSRADVDPSAGRTRFNLRLKVTQSYEQLLDEHHQGEIVAPADLLEDLPCRVLMHSPGGAGKSAALAAIGRAALDNGLVPFYAVTAKGGLGGEKLPKRYSLPEFLDTLSIAGGIRDLLSALATGSRVILLIDGMNEVYREASEQLLKWLADEATTSPTLSVIVADRMAAQREAHSFKRAAVLPLRLEDVRQVLNRDLPDDPSILALLQLPFFLDLQMDARDGAYLDRGPMIARYLGERAGVTSEERWAALSRCAFEAYATWQGRSFDASDWGCQLGDGFCAELENNGVVATSSVDGMSRFRHQLLHDYLVGHHVAASDPRMWTPPTFDCATFKANSNESLTFAAELLQSPKADAFVTEVYDWNYNASFQCIGDLRRWVRAPAVSNELGFALSALRAEKRFDLVEDTVRSANDAMGRLSSPLLDPLWQAEGISALLNLVRSTFQSVPARYQQWSELFTRSGEASETDVALLDRDPLIGWTAANVLRRLTVSPALHVSIRNVYRSNRDVPGSKLDRPSHRWRSVHVLGSYPSRENEALLWLAALDDTSEWVRYGAVRSLMEMAFRDESLRDRIVGRFLSDLPRFDAPSAMEAPILLRELGRCCLISASHAASAGWYQAVLGLAEAASALPGGQRERAFWEHRLAAIRTRAGRNG